jgi:DNA-binding beta-propeller fold protein YncE
MGQRGFAVPIWGRARLTSVRGRAVFVALVLGLFALVGLAAATAGARASSGTWERSWGKDVLSTGGSGFGEICTVAAQCKGGILPPTTAQGGEFNTPEGVAVDSAGNLYVADTFNDRVQKFDAAGNFLQAWGKDVISGGVTTAEICSVAASCKAGVAGGLGGEFSDPTGIAIDSQGYIYVSEAGNFRIQKFDSNGNFQLAWGKGVNPSVPAGYGICVAAASCVAGALGTLAGEFNLPLKMATDAAGHLYVAENTNRRVQRFDLAGNFQRAWGKDVISSGSHNNGTGPEICVAVVDTCKQGEAGVAPVLGGELGFAVGLGTDAAGNVYVTDTENNRMQKFDGDGNFLRAWGKDVLTTGGAGFEICTAAASCKAGATGGLGGEFDSPAGAATDAGGHVYITDRNNSRVQRFDQAGNFELAWGKNVITGGAGGFEICAVAANCKTGNGGGLGGELSFPEGVATDAAGDLYVSEGGNERISRFADAVIPPPPVISTPGPTGQRAAALKKCKKKHGSKRKKCRKKAKRLPA